MEIDDFMKRIDVRRTGVKETVGAFAKAKMEETGEGVSLIEVINLQGAYIDLLRKALLHEKEKD